jgi:hypothetical protein
MADAALRTAAYQLEWKVTISPMRMPSSNRKKARRQVMRQGLRQGLFARQQPNGRHLSSSRRHLPSFSRSSGVPQRRQKLRHSPSDGSK